MDIIETFKFCRVCLEPEEAEPFTSIFDNNATIALKIYQLVGILMFDIDKKVPSLICIKCIKEIEAVEKLKMRILDADEYYAMMTVEREKEFLNVDMKKLMNQQTFKTPESKKELPTIKKDPKWLEIKVKQEPIDNEAVFPKKRKLKSDYDSIGIENVNTNWQIPSPVSRQPFLPKATPSKLGIHRMVIKTKTKSKPSTVMSLFNPQKFSTPALTSTASQKKNKRSFKPRLRIGGSSKSRNRKKSTNEHTITFECDNCKKTFESYQLLNDHIVEHNFEEPFSCISCEASFANEEYLKIHVLARHIDNGQME